MNHNSEDKRNTVKIDRGELPQESPEVIRCPRPHEAGIQEGNWVGSRYRISELIGEGAFSKVYRAWDGLLHRWIALKLYAADVSLNVARDEIEWQARIQHPNLMPILDAGVDPALERYFVVMPLYPGETLDALLNRMGPLPVKIALVYCDQVLSALDFIERGRGGIHGDIKPANIWVTRDGSAVLMDYGIATVVEEGGRVGTPGYGAPETISGMADIRSDIFSVGCVLYFMLTGIEPFANDYDVLHKSISPPSALRPDLRPYLDQITLKAMDGDPEKRFGSAREMRNAIRHPPIWERLRGRSHSRSSLGGTFLHLLSRSILISMFRPRSLITMLGGILLLIMLIPVMVILGIILAARGLSVLQERYPWMFALLALGVVAIISRCLSKRFCRFSGRFWDIFMSLIAPGLGNLNAGSFHAGIVFLSAHSIFMLVWWLPGLYWEMLKRGQMWIFAIAIVVWVAPVIHVLHSLSGSVEHGKPASPLFLLLGAVLGAAAAAPFYAPHIFAEVPGRIPVLKGIPIAIAVIAGAPAGTLASILLHLLSPRDGVTGSLILWQIMTTCLACGWALLLARVRKPLGTLGVLFVNMGEGSLRSGSSFGWLRALLGAQFWERTLVQAAVILLVIELGYRDSWLMRRVLKIYPASSEPEITNDGDSDKSTYRFR